MSLPAEELDEMIRKDEEMLNDGVTSESLLEIDFMGMSEDEIIRKYHCRPWDVVYIEILDKLRWLGEIWPVTRVRSCRYEQESEMTEELVSKYHMISNAQRLMEERLPLSEYHGGQGDNVMGMFVFASKWSDVALIAESYKIVAVPSPDNDYITFIAYYRNPAIREGEFETRDLPCPCSDVYLYVRKIDETDYRSYRYNGSVKAHRHIVDDVQYDDILNLLEIEMDVEKCLHYLIETHEK